MSQLATAVLCATGLAPATLAAQSDSAGAGGVAVYAEVRLVSRYIWRGYDDSRNTPSLQPYAELTLPFGLAANTFVTTGLDAHRQLDEAQFGLGWVRAVGGWELGLGYLHYILPGTATEPSPGVDPLQSSTSGEVYLRLSRSWDDASATLTYSRGNRAGRGNSLNLWLERDWEWADGSWGVQPYVQLDYLDEYDAPSGFAQRFSLLEVGLPLTRRLGPVRLLVSAQLSFVPSSYVRASNREAGAGAGIALPWVAAGIVYER